MTHKECGYLMEVSLEAALSSGRGIWVDSSMRDRHWYRGILVKIRQRYPEYRIAILSVTASRRAILERALQRQVDTGRHVPEEDILDSLWRVPLTLDALAPYV
jgi:DNA-binding transcriptional LysR family regulator